MYIFLQIDWEKIFNLKRKLVPFNVNPKIILQSSQKEIKKKHFIRP